MPRHGSEATLTLTQESHTCSGSLPNQRFRGGPRPAASETYRYARGHITVLNRDSLEDYASECHLGGPRGH